MNIQKFYFIAKCVLINEDNKILILKRTDYKKNGTGDLWDFLGGSVDLDEEVNVAIKREAREEIQVELEEVIPFHIDSGAEEHNSQYVFVIFYSKNYNSKNGIKLSNEHCEYKWISVDEIDEYKYYLKEGRLNAIKLFLKGLK